MKGKFQTNFDALSVALLFLLFFCSICLTSVVKHVLFYFLPLLFLIKKLFFRASFIREVSYRRSPLLSLIVWQLFLIPIIMGLVHGDFDLSNIIYAQWINHYNSWLILYAYLTSNYFLHLSEKKSLLQDSRASLLALITFLLAFVVDFFYSFFKWLSHDLSLERWQGSSGNPQLWAVQASLMLIVWLIIHRDVDQWFQSKIYSRLILILISAAILLTGSISNFIGLSFASLAWLLPWASLALLITLTYVIGINLLTWDFLLHYQGSIADLKNIFHNFSNKFIPRIKLWLDLLKESPNVDLDYLSGIGLDAYNDFLDKATASKHENVHSLYFHNWLINGAAGLYSSFIFLVNALEKICSNKYYLAICLYTLSSSTFDCALNFLEVQILFWLVLPFIIDRIDSKILARDFSGANIK